jgi:putative transposase
VNRRAKHLGNAWLHEPVLRSKPGVKFAFIEMHKDQYKVVRMCKLLDVSSSGLYIWRERPASPILLESKRLLGLIKESFKASHQTYGSPRVLCDLHELGETCNQKRVARLMRANKLRVQQGWLYLSVVMDLFSRKVVG